MKRNSLISKIMFVCASITSNIMCVFVTYRLVDHLHHPFQNSAPASINLIYAIPFLLVISLFLIIGFSFSKKETTKERKRVV